MYRWRWLVLALALVAGAPVVRAEAPRAVATVGMIADVARNVAGDCVEVDALMGPGVDPHLYQARASDVRAFERADAILYAGYSLEGQLGKVLGKLAAKKPTVAVAPASIDPGDLITVQDIYGIDPHLWMDVDLWGRIAPTIADTFAEIAPDCVESMQARASGYREQLAALDAWIAKSVASIPEEQRVLVTAHDAFAYYGRAYGIEVKGIQGISTESEAGLQRIRELVDLIVTRGIGAVFVESSVPDRNVRALVEGARAGGHAVEVGGTLFSDAMGEPGTYEGTYIGMIDHNVTTITRALGGSAPAGGMSGQLARS